MHDAASVHICVCSRDVVHDAASVHICVCSRDVVHDAASAWRPCSCMLHDAASV